MMMPTIGSGKSFIAGILFRAGRHFNPEMAGAAMKKD